MDARGLYVSPLSVVTNSPGFQGPNTSLTVFRFRAVLGGGGLSGTHGGTPILPILWPPPPVASPMAPRSTPPSWWGDGGGRRGVFVGQVRGVSSPLRALARTPYRVRTRHREAAVWLCARQEGNGVANTWPASATRTFSSSSVPSGKSREGCLMPGACEQGLATQGWGRVPVRGHQEPSPECRHQHGALR